MPDDSSLREAVLTLLRGGRAHVSFEKTVAKLPEDLRGKKPRGVPYTPWQHPAAALGGVAGVVSDSVAALVALCSDSPLPRGQGVLECGLGRVHGPAEAEHD